MIWVCSSITRLAGLAYHGRHCEVSVVHVLSQPVDLATSIAENNCLSNGESVVQVTQCVQLPVLALHVHEELLDTCTVKKRVNRETNHQCKDFKPKLPVNNLIIKNDEH